MEDLKRYIREVPDFPKPGINFFDITTLLKDPLALRMTVDRFAWLFARRKEDAPIDQVEAGRLMVRGPRSGVGLVVASAGASKLG